MTDVKKRTDASLSNAERKDLRGREAKEAIADHEEAQRALLGNLERLREERLARETAARPMFYPAPELPDDTPIENVRFSTRIRNALTIAGLKTVGEIREATDAMLLSLQYLGKGSVDHLILLSQKVAFWALGILDNFGRFVFRHEELRWITQ